MRHAAAIVGVVLVVLPGVEASQAATLRGNGIDRATRAFVENRGQWPEDVRFLTRARGAWVWADAQGLWIDLPPRPGARDGLVLRMAIEEISDESELVGLDRLSAIHSFFLGNDPARWVGGAPSYAAVGWKNVQPGIDLVSRVLDDGSLKYDVLVAPGADLSRLVLRCDGSRRVVEEDEGVLRIESDVGFVRHRLGPSFEVQPDGFRRPVIVRHRLLPRRRIGLEVEGRDPARPLVIDPGLVWSTYLGSSGGVVGDTGYGVAFDPTSGDVIAVGEKDGPTFPTTPGAYQHPGSRTDVYVTRLAAADGSLVYSCVLGGISDQERPNAVVVDATGRPVVVGRTFGSDFPTTPGAFDTVRTTVAETGFAFRLSESGDALEWSTYLESSWSASAYAVALDPRTGSVVVGGTTTDGVFPTTPGAWDETPNGSSDGFVTRIDPSGSFLEWSTYFGGSGLETVLAVAVDEIGDVYLTGETQSADLPTTPGAFDRTLGHLVFRSAFVAKLSGLGDRLLWSTYLGGDTVGAADVGMAIQVSSGMDVFVGGQSSPSFPTTPGAFQSGIPGGFATRFDQAGALIASTTLGGPGSEPFKGLFLDGAGVATLAFQTDGAMPIVPGGYSDTYIGPPWDGAVARLNPSLSRLLYSSYVGGPGYEVIGGSAMSAEGRVALTGATQNQFPTTPCSASPTYNGGQTDAFVFVLDPVLTGTTPVGRSVPACRGPIQLNAWAVPTSGATDFGLWASGAPPFARGKLLLGRPRSSAVQRAGVALWVDGTAPLRIVAVQADADGYLEIPLSLAGAPSGGRFGAQVVFETTGCPPSGPLASSPGLEVVVQ
jgi:hypothetical protein